MLRMPKPRYENSVFINCPFDPEYKPIMWAIVFAVHDLGFAARMAPERDDSGENRLHKIMEFISECKYGIHDLSRIELNANGIPRFNMPFELGLFLGCKQYGAGKRKTKITLILDSKAYRYRESCSDLSGFDIKIHNNDARAAVGAVRAWLAPTPERTKKHGAQEIWRRYELFQAKLPIICADQKITLDELRFPERAQFMQEFIIELDDASDKS